MKHKALICIFLLANLLLITVAGCSDSNTATTISPEVKAKQEQEASQTLAQYLYENFGGGGNPKYATSWYSGIQQLRVELTNDGRFDVNVSTPYYAGKHDQIAENTARAIAGAIAYNGKIDVRCVTVYGVNGILCSVTFPKRTTTAQ